MSRRRNADRQRRSRERKAAEVNDTLGESSNQSCEVNLMTQDYERRQPEEASQGKQLPGSSPVTEPPSLPPEKPKDLESVATESHADRQLDKKQDQRNDQIAAIKIDKLQTIFNGGLFAIGLLEIVILVFQICLFRTQNGIMTTQNAIMKLDVRPWLKVGPPTITKFKVGDRMEYTCRMENVGKIPAEVIATCFYSHIPATDGEAESVAATVKLAIEDDGDEKDSAIAPNTAINHPFAGDIVTDEMLRSVTWAARPTYIIGYVKYADASGKKYITECCFLSPPGNPEGVTLNFNYRHNHMK